MSQLAVLWEQKLLFLGLIMVVVLCVVLSPRAKTAAEYCRDAASARQTYENALSSNNIARTSGIYITVDDDRDMDRREQTTAQIAGTLQRVCEDEQRLEADRAEMTDLQNQFDLSRINSYTRDQRLAVFKAAGFMDSLAQPPSLSSFAGKLALLRAFRDHPDLYH